MAGKPLSAPIVGIVATPDAHGYWLVAKDGGVFTFGDASFKGSLNSMGANIVGAASSDEAAAGATGAKGPVGSKGPTGSRGPVGAVGDTGANEPPE